MVDLLCQRSFFSCKNNTLNVRINCQQQQRGVERNGELVRRVRNDIRHVSDATRGEQALTMLKGEDSKLRIASVDGPVQDARMGFHICTVGY